MRQSGVGQRQRRRSAPVPRPCELVRTSTKSGSSAPTLIGSIAWRVRGPSVRVRRGERLSTDGPRALATARSKAASSKPADPASHPCTGRPGPRVAGASASGAHRVCLCPTPPSGGMRAESPRLSPRNAAECRLSSTASAALRCSAADPTLSRRSGPGLLGLVVQQLATWPAHWSLCEGRCACHGHDVVEGAAQSLSQCGGLAESHAPGTLLDALHRLEREPGAFGDLSLSAAGRDPRFPERRSELQLRVRPPPGKLTTRYVDNLGQSHCLLCRHVRGREGSGHRGPTDADRW